MLRLVLGGACALVMAGLVLWWIAAEHLGGGGASPVLLLVAVPLAYVGGKYAPTGTSSREP